MSEINNPVINDFNSLDLSVNSKVSFKEKHFNTFGTMFGRPENGGTCPGATLGKGGCCSVKQKNTSVCYVDKLTKIRPQIKVILERNTDLLSEKSFDDLVIIFRNTFLKFLLLNKGKEQVFRLYWSGDVSNEITARALVKVIKEFPFVKFWQYTRSLFAVPILVEAKNLSLYISIDEVNREKALLVYNIYKSHSNLALAWMGNEKPDAPVKYITCPESSGVIKNKENRGACADCGLCWNKANKPLRHIHFPIH